MGNYTISSLLKNFQNARYIRECNLITVRIKSKIIRSTYGDMIDLHLKSQILRTSLKHIRI